MDVDQPWLKHGVISEKGTVCRAGLNDGLFFRNDELFQIIVCIIRCVYRAELILGR